MQDHFEFADDFPKPKPLPKLVRCPAWGCQTLIKRGFVMCRPHWEPLPDYIKAEIIDSWPSDPREPGMRHIFWVWEAVRYLLWCTCAPEGKKDVPGILT